MTGPVAPSESNEVSSVADQLRHLVMPADASVMVEVLHQLVLQDDVPDVADQPHQILVMADMDPVMFGIGVPSPIPPESDPMLNRCMCTPTLICYSCTRAHAGEPAGPRVELPRGHPIRRHIRRRR